MALSLLNQIPRPIPLRLSIRLLVSVFNIFIMTSVNAEPCTTTCCATTNHLPPISYGYAPRQCCAEASRSDSYNYEWDLSWLFDNNPSRNPAPPAMDERPPSVLSPWVSPPLPEVCWPVVDSKRGTPNGIAPVNETPRMDYAAGYSAPSCQLANLDVNNNWCSSMPAPSPNPPVQFMASSFVPPSLSVGAGLLPPFSCFLNPDRHPMYFPNGQVDINNNDVAGEVAGEVAAAAEQHVPVITSTPCPPVTTSSERSPIPPPPPTCTADTARDGDEPLPSPRIRQILSDVLPRRRHRLPPLRKQFPELEGITTDLITDLIRTAKFGEGRFQRVAQEELESTTIVSLQTRLMDIVPGLADRGISTASVTRLLLPLNTRIIKSCLRDESAWRAVTEVLDIYGELDSIGTEIFDDSYS